MRAGLLLLHVAVAAGAVALYFVLFPSGARPQPPVGSTPAANALQADAGVPDAALADGIGLQLMKARGALQAGGTDADLRALFAAAGVELDPAAESRVFPVCREHFAALQRNLEAAHGAALGNATAARRTALRARGVALYTAFTQALREHLDAEQVVDFLRACPEFVPPPPGAAADDAEPSRPGGSSVPWPAPTK